MKTLYISDLDGTLLGRDSRISARSAALLGELIGRGIFFTYATARSVHSLPAVTAGLDVRLPVILQNGSEIRTADSVLRKLEFTKRAAADVLAALRAQGVQPLVYASFGARERVAWLRGAETEGLRWYLGGKRGDSRLSPLPDERGLCDGRVFYFVSIGTAEELSPAYEALLRREDCSCVLHKEPYRSEYWLEVMPAGGGKREAALWLKKYLCCDRMIVFGDGANDLPLFEAADACYAVANAVPELKTCASAVIASNEEDGVALWLAARAGLDGERSCSNG